MFGMFTGDKSRKWIFWAVSLFLVCLGAGGARAADLSGNLDGQTDADSPEAAVLKLDFPKITPTPSLTPTPTFTLGNTWTHQTSGTLEYLYGVEFGDSTFVAVGSNGTVLTSPDGITWSPQTSGTVEHLYGMVFGNSTFVAVGSNGTVLTSADGTSWASRSSGTTNTLYGVAFGNSTFVAVGLNGTILTSPDGIAWTSQTSGTSNRLWGVGYGDSTFVTEGDSGKILTSPDGITWSPQTSGTSYVLYGIGFGDSTFVTVGYYGTILTSPDGITWTSRTLPHTFDILIGVIFGNSTFVTVGNEGKIFTSSDAIAWTSRPSGTTNLLRNGVFANSTFVIVGEGGTILTSSPPTPTPTGTLTPRFTPVFQRTIPTLPTVGTGTPTPFATVQIPSGTLANTVIEIPGGEFDNASITIAEVTNVPLTITGDTPATVLALRVSEVSGCVSGLTISIPFTGLSDPKIAVFINGAWVEVSTTVSGGVATGRITCAQLGAARASSKDIFGFDRAAGDIVIVGVADRSALAVPSMGRLGLVLLFIALTGLMIRNRYRIHRTL